MSDAPDEIKRLIEEYADGTLGADDTRRLLELAQADPDIRRRLAEAAVLERLLRGLARGPVPVERIMQAIADRQAAARPPPAPPATTANVHSWITSAALLIVLIGVAVWLAWPVPEDRPPVAATALPAPPTTPGSATPATEPKSKTETRPTEPPPAPAEPTPPARPLSYLAAAYPPELPPAPPDAAAEPPAGDGSGEPGFVPPPPATTGSPEPDGPTAARREAEAPLLWVKVIGAPAVRWSSTSTDLDALDEAVRQRSKVRYRHALRPLDDIGDDPARHPVLLFTTHYRFAFTPAERARLRRFVLAGGMIVFDAGGGSRPAAESAHRETRLILPERPPAPVEPDDPLLHAYYDLPAAAADGLQHVTLACRAAIVLAPRGLAGRWAAAPAHEESLRLGVNLASYAAAVRAWAQQAARRTAFAEPEGPEAGRLSIVQVMHAGDWRTRPGALSHLLHAYNRQTAVPVQLRVRETRLDEAELFNAPLLYLTGHYALELSPAEEAALGRYLQSGGFLLAEACCGRRAFDRSFRALLTRLRPGAALQAVPPDDPLRRSPHVIGRLAGTRSLAARAGGLLVEPRLEGLRIGEHYAVIYSPYGLAGAWESSPLPYADGYDDPGALRLGQNILHYAITH